MDREPEKGVSGQDVNEDALTDLWRPSHAENAFRSTGISCFIPTEVNKMLNSHEISLVKTYLSLGHKQHEIAAHFNVNSGRIAEIATGRVGAYVAPAKTEDCPPIEKKVARFFTPKQPLEEQISIFTDLVNSARPNAPAYVHLITPQLAEWLLKNRNGGNRPRSSRNIDLYAEAMEEKDWPVTGATIIVGRAGFLLDGQHRLCACVRSGESFMTYVVFGIDEANFTRIDTGRKRTNIDAFHVAGIPNASAAAKAARWLKIHWVNPEDRSVTYTNDDLIKWIRNEGGINIDLFNECVSLAISVKKDSKLLKCEMPDGQMAALLYLFAKKNKKQMLEFANILRVGNKQPAISLYASIKKVKGDSGGRVNEVLRNGRVIQAWNLWREGKRVSERNINYTPLSDEYPHIV